MDKLKFRLGDVVQIKSNPQAIGYIRKMGYNPYFGEGFYYIEWFQKPDYDPYLNYDEVFFEKYLRRLK